MSKNINVLFIHGIGGDKSRSHETMLKNIKKRLPKCIHLNVVAVKYLAEINEYQDENFSAMYSGKNKKYLRPFKYFRKKFLNSFGDASTILHDKEAYADVMKLIDEGLKDLTDMNDDPTVVISQSLGCQMFSCYMWDARLRGYYSKWQKRVVLWFTTGNNMRVFMSGTSYRKNWAFKAPNDHFKWFNFWNWGDILGYPMKSVSETYSRLLNKDIHIMKGVPILSHTKYDSSKKVTKRIAKEIMRL